MGATSESLESGVIDRDPLREPCRSVERVGVLETAPGDRIMSLAGESDIPGREYVEFLFESTRVL